ncbi:hypothetical protein [Pseudomonas graminis]|uniref:Uncharacterized protein n=1 Tax=Pseudomonas graminis TaxID=158627 RepID=A0A1I0HZG4_9PSED|nr:hypothetical protein [Pseudomonas graminis]SET89327.1 hypothetical protein SAMN05216197_1316 [Pseudomonas graminis]
MRPYECGSTSEDRKWESWLGRCEHIAGRSLQHIDDHSDLFDYYSGGLTPVEAVAEAAAQQQQLQA